MTNFKHARLLALLVATVSMPAFAQNIAVVNGKPIPSSRADAMVKQMVQQGQQDTPEMRAMIKDELINREILAQEAEKLGVANKPEVKSQLDLSRQSIVIRALATDFIKSNPVKEEEMKAEYDKFKAQSGGKEYHARHILVEKEDDAKGIITNLKGGAKFEEGAVFAKIAYTVGFDARFPSSYEPNKFSRIQFMKKDSKRYQSTDGWGYALYLQNSEQEEKFGDMELQACHACHKLAANHDYVFDTPVFVSSNKFVASGRDFFENFRSIRLKDAPAVVSNLLKTFDKNVPKDLLDYQITAFQGTISESMLPVARLASERTSPVLLRANDSSGFVLAIKTKQSDLNCSKAAKLWVKDIQLIPGQAASETPREMIFCDGVFK
jgi:hypothetical protein